MQHIIKVLHSICHWGRKPILHNVVSASKTPKKNTKKAIMKLFLLFGQKFFGLFALFRPPFFHGKKGQFEFSNPNLFSQLKNRKIIFRIFSNQIFQKSSQNFRDACTAPQLAPFRFHSAQVEQLDIRSRATAFEPIAGLTGRKSKNLT